MNTLNDDYDNVDCIISCYCPIYPSESPEKIIHAICNVFGDVNVDNNDNRPDENNDLQHNKNYDKIILNKYSAQFTTKNLHILEKIFKTIRSKNNQKIYRRQLMKNLDKDNNSTWFYLNKQAAFVDSIVVCTESQESPLMPIKLIIQSRNDIDRIIEWLVSN